MKFVQFAYKNKPREIRVGFVEGNCIVDVNARDPNLPKTMLGLLQKNCMWRVKEFETKKPCCMTAIKDVILKAPIHGMDKILCTTINYKDLSNAARIVPQSYPCFSSKFRSCVIGPSDVLKIREETCKKVDFEVELCVVIGKKAVLVKQENAEEYIFGCTVAQDISSRDWQYEQNSWQQSLSKSMDTFCPLGPWIVTMDEIGDLYNLNMYCQVNGIYRQKGNTSDMIHRVPAIIERLSTVLTLLPGDIILTGTPAGSANYDRAIWLHPGDVIRSEIENIGVLETKVAAYERPDPYSEW